MSFNIIIVFSSYTKASNKLTAKWNDCVNYSIPTSIHLAIRNREAVMDHPLTNCIRLTKMPRIR